MKDELGFATNKGQSGFSRIAARYEKTAGCYLSMVLLGAILIWTKFVNSP
jgi:hypothetical protein